MEDDPIQIIGTERTEDSFLSKIIAVRHAESVANAHGVYQGQTHDTDLSDLGVKQARALAKRLAGLGLTKIIASPLRRTYQTALEVSRVCGCPVEINNLIIETNHGEWEGKEKSLVQKLYPDVYETWLTKPSQTVFPGGEAFIQMLERLELFLESDLLSNDTLLVTHDNVIRILVTLANGWTLDDIWVHNIEPAALNFFEINKLSGKNKLSILKLNESDHLEGIRADINKHAL
jgi:broad specificity phosphatase PhoE